MTALAPPARWQTAVLVVLGVFVGFGVTLFHVSGGTSYLSSNPEACINCHLMTPQFAKWQRGPHRTNATCVDCHLPHDNLIHKWVAKMDAGLRHVWVFSTRTEPYILRARARSAEYVEGNCVRCHQPLLETTWLMEYVAQDDSVGSRRCWDCHRGVGHPGPEGLGSAPNALWLPMAQHAVPLWLQELMKASSEQPGS